MKNKLFKSLSILGATTLLAACNFVSSTNAAKLLRDPKDANAPGQVSYYNDYRDFREKLQTFANKISESFVKREYKEGKNITVSPISVEMCLGLAIRSTDSNTRKQILDAIGVDYETFNKFYAIYFRDLSRSGDGGEISLTNSIWIDNDIVLKDDGLDALRDDYYCYSYEVDFDKAPKETAREVKKFVNEKTKGLINPDFEFDESTIFMLMNTLYLKDIWNEEGLELSYADKSYTFTNSDDSVSKKQLLQGYYNDGRTLQTEDYSSFYTSTQHGLSLHFVKPNDGKRAKDVFTKEAMDYVLDRGNYILKDDEKLERYHTNCIFPEYAADSDFDLIPMLLEDFKITDLFDPLRADFGPLTDDDAYVEEARHMAKLEVDKSGIKGAAVTYMAVCGSAGPGPEEYKDIYETFEVYKEFGFILTFGNAILFSGIVTNIDK